MSTQRLIGFLSLIALLGISAPWHDAAGQQPAAQAVRVAPAAVKKTAASQVSRLSTRPEDKRYAADRLAAGNKPGGYVCETHNHFTSCECKGALDCFELANSGKCKGGTWWEDDNDPSVGGCDFNEP